MEELLQNNNTFAIASVNSDTTVIAVLIDINGCKSPMMTVNINLIKIIAAANQQSGVTCSEPQWCGKINVNGGNAGYTFAIDGGASQVITSSWINPGIHTITAMDVNGARLILP